ncbi:MAG TPA: GMC family oxidoreductase N-terminal domain-containing protein [Caulobacteraceae bacterium]
MSDAGDAEIIVAGGGSAGCAMAGRLAAAGVKVLLLEAGKTGEHIRLKIPALVSGVVQDPEFDWKHRAEPDPSIGGRSDIWPAGKRLGGGSSINGMLYVRGHRWDYDHWAELGARGWAFKDVAPYFKRAETNSRGASAYRGDGGPLSVSDGRLDYPIISDWVRAAQSWGLERNLDHNGERPGEGVDFAQNTQKNGLRNPATSYLKLPGARENLRVELEARVLRILFEHGRAVGVEYQQGGERRRALARGGVVLSAGNINTPKVLMLSGVGPAAQLAGFGIPVIVDAPGVGKNLQEHVGTHLVNRVATPTLNGDARGFALLRHMADFLVRRRGILTTSIGHAQAFVRSRPGLSAPNLQITFTCFAFDFDGEGRLVLRKDNAVSTMVCLSRPRSRGTVSLRSADPLDPPVIRHQLLEVEDDAVQIAEGIEIARQIMDQPSVRPDVVSEVRPGEGLSGEALLQYVRLASIPLYHSVGACRMGQDSGAVVDPDLKVRGVTGLWVCDASVMPSLPAGNTNATAIMIGDKGSDHVLHALRNTPMQGAAA